MFGPDGNICLLRTVQVSPRGKASDLPFGTEIWSADFTDIFASLKLPKASLYLVIIKNKKEYKRHDLNLLLLIEAFSQL
jgi:hypothetical protein